MGAIYADYELVERLGESELTALFKGKHILIPDRFRTFKMPQEESKQFADIFKQEKLRVAFSKVCETAILVANARDAASPAERAAAETIGFIETVHYDREKPDKEKPYLVMEWVDGESLAEKIARGPLPLEDVVSISRAVLQCLAFTHSRGIIHGNIKPNNILIAEGGIPKLADFGGNVVGGGTPVRFGSIPYLSPEQLNEETPDGPAIDARTDLYSYTLVLYEMLTGRRLGRVLTPAQMPARLLKQIPAAFDEIILKGLQTDLRLRFQDAPSMLERICEALETSFRSAGSQSSRHARISAAPALAPPPVKDEDSVVVVRETAPTEASEPPPPVKKRRKAGELRINEKDGAEMVWVPGGTLHMGSDANLDEYPAEAPEHDVEVSGFWLYRYPVTQALYLAYCRSQQLPPPRTRLGGMWLVGDQHQNKPVAGIRWPDAMEYAQWVKGRLPTEAEWEWAARGEQGSPYPWGDTWNASFANSEESALYEQTDVNRYSANRSWCGAVDMLGNVFEWCSSLYRPYPYNAEDGRENLKTAGPRVLRGGSANSPTKDVHAAFRCPPSASATLTGFRIAVNDDESGS